jgi:hypothetical protein
VARRPLGPVGSAASDSESHSLDLSTSACFSQHRMSMSPPLMGRTRSWNSLAVVTEADSRPWVARQQTRTSAPRQNADLPERCALSKKTQALAAFPLFISMRLQPWLLAVRWVAGMSASGPW